MNTNYLHYKVEIAFDRMEEALLEVQEHAEPGDKLFYGRLMDELIGIRDHYRQELIDLHTKKAAPAAATTETANDSDKESTFSLDEKTDDVKRSCLNLKVIDDETTEVELSIHGPAEHLLMLYSAAVEAFTFAAPDFYLHPEDLEKAYRKGVDRAIERLVQRVIKTISASSDDKRERLFSFTKAIDAPEELLQRLFGGEGK